MKILNSIKEISQKISSDYIGEYTAQCAYYTFLSLIPFAILLLTMIKYINIDKDTLRYILDAILPNIMENSALDVIQEIYSKSFETISISAIFLLWSAGKSFYALSKGISAIYKEKEEKRANYFFLRLKGIIGTIIILISIVAVLIILVFGNTINAIIQENFEGFSNITEFILSIRSVLVMLLLFVVFLVLYKFTPGKNKRSIKSQIPGAIFASIGWYLISYFFSIYVDVFTNFSIIYGSLTTIILIMMWLYAIIYLILLGAEINVISEKKQIFTKIKNRIKKV